jgi:hypothetical protein
MAKISAIISTDGEIIPSSDFGSEKEFQFKTLNSLDFESVKDFFIKRTIFQAVKEKHNLSNGSNGVTSVELNNLFKWTDIEVYIKELENKNLIKTQKGINSEMYFLCNG